MEIGLNLERSIEVQSSSQFKKIGKLKISIETIITEFSSKMLSEAMGKRVIIMAFSALKRAAAMPT